MSFAHFLHYLHVAISSLEWISESSSYAFSIFKPNFPRKILILYVEYRAEVERNVKLQRQLPTHPVQAAQSLPLRVASLSQDSAAQSRKVALMLGSDLSPLQ